MFQENCRLIIASTAPTAPTAADSVGVAIPARIDPKTSTIRTNGGTITEKIEGSTCYHLIPLGQFL